MNADAFEREELLDSGENDAARGFVEKEGRTTKTRIKLVGIVTVVMACLVLIFTFSFRSDDTFWDRHSSEEIMSNNERFYEEKLKTRNEYIKSAPEYFKRKWWIWTYYEPYWQCPFGAAQLIGSTQGDGGKWVCGLQYIEDPCIVYSMGSENNTKFEDFVREKTTCEIHIFDPTSNHIKDYAVDVWDEHYTFHALGITDETDSTFDYQNETYNGTDIYSIMEKFGHDHIDILKIDIEGAEFDVVNGWRARGFPNIGQIQVEVHLRDLNASLIVRNDSALSQQQLYHADLNGRHAWAKLSTFMDDIESEGFRMFYKEHNVLWSKGMEFAFINKDWTPEVHGRSHFKKK